MSENYDSRIRWSVLRSVVLCTALALASPGFFPNTVCAEPIRNSVDQPGSPLKKVVRSIDVRNVGINELFAAIKKALGEELYFVCNRQLDESIGRITAVKMQNATVEAILQKALEGKNVEFSSDKNVILFRAVVTRQHKLTGVILDDTGAPLVGATVVVSGTTRGTVADAKGGFSLVAREGEILDVNFIGFKKQRITVKNGDRLSIKLEKDNVSIENVVVTGYQRIDVRKNTSAIQTLKMDEILNPGMTSLQQALEGRVPEMTFTLNSGEVGTTARLRVRGTSTILGNREPLWVLDGFILTDPVAVSNEDLNNPDYVNIIGNAIQGINPQDIERIDILKDASATALYGTRAANGVIVVTTKKGVQGKPVVSYNHSSKITRRPRYTDRAINLMNSQERVNIGRELVEDHYAFPSNMTKVGYEGAWYQWQTGDLTYDQFQQNVNWFESVNTDWFSALTRDSYSHDHTVSLSGGTEKVRYYTSVGYNRENGVTKSTFTERMSARVNLNATLTEKIKLNYSINGNISNKNHLPSELNAMDYAYNTTRALPLYNEDGSYYNYDLIRYNHGAVGYEGYRFNILNEIDNSSDSYKGNGVNTMLDIKWNPIESLEISASGNYQINSTDQDLWWGERTNYVARYKNGEYEDEPRKGDGGKCALPYGGILNSTFSRSQSWSVRLQADYRKAFGPERQHLVTATLGYEARSSTNYSYATQTRGYFKDRGMQFVDVSNIEEYPLYQEWMSKPNRTITNGLSNNISGYVTMSYSYEDLFTVNANTRFDASNKFGSRSNERFLPVWSASGMLNLKTLIVPEDWEWINDMRLRGSYGSQGNMLDSESPELIIKQGTTDPYFNQNISTVSRYPNPNLRWEKTNQWNLGLDVSLFEGRMNLALSSYGKKTNEVFTSVDVSSVNGVKLYVMNGGSLKNSGYSISVSGYPIRTKDVQWYLSTYYDGNFNKAYSNDVENYKYTNYLDGSAIVSGEPISTFYSYNFIGLNPKNGAPMFRDYEDQQHLLKGKSLEDVVKTVMLKSGQRDPVFNGNLSTSVTYKKLTVSAMLSYSLGSKVRLFQLYSPVQTGVRSDINLRREFNNRWRSPGDEYRTNIPAIIGTSHPDYSYLSTHFSSLPYAGTSSERIEQFASNVWNMYDNSQLRVISGDYLKLSSLSVRYMLEPKLLKQTPFKTMTLSASTQNLFTLSSKKLKGQDPSQAGFADASLSVRPQYTIQVNITF